MPSSNEPTYVRLLAGRPKDKRGRPRGAYLCPPKTDNKEKNAKKQ